MSTTLTPRILVLPRSDDQAPRPTGGVPRRDLRPQLPRHWDHESLRNGGDLEVTARIAVHESTRTTQLYNRLNEEIERIHTLAYRHAVCSRHAAPWTKRGALRRCLP